MSTASVMESLDGECQSLELLKAQALGWNHIFSFINSMSLKCAVELGIADIIHAHGKPISLLELATKLSIPPIRNDDLRRLMRLLVFSGFFARKRDGNSQDHDDEELYIPTTASALLVKEKDANISSSLLLMLDQMFLNPWHHLSSWFKQDKVSAATPFEAAPERGIVEATSQSPGFNSFFNEGMASDARFVAKLVVEECAEVFRGLRSLVDVGGGTGAMARAIAEAYPQVKCTVLELPYVVASSEASETVQLVAGDMFQYVPPADAVLLKWVLHDWSDEECVKILKRCKEAVPSKEEGGKVIIIEMVVDFDIGRPELVETQLLFDMHMMVHTAGKQRNEGEWKNIFTDAGFTNYKIIPALGLRSVMEVYH
ncbi:trans-resveratrol di-O-methyltransferase-like [Phoenix dactylifera]|uniref:Trans-resveratrol di-O-methyltransferase-like n=1 Tax=Phoenix dactylifera TaxID=42345 RepID=A0A8B7BZ35_PHODC|nr:trans-resveratrol di-O-methyltransferase-like [Phoenix dactylifera]